MSSGKSKSETNKNGLRRIINGKELAPKAMRKKGKKFLSDCSDEELEKYSKIKRKIKEET
jgi:hypothetical protein